ncbi:MAG: hypothetical protein Q9217_002614 [Psora testacea]
MDDLSSVDWTAPKAPALPDGLAQGPRGNYYPALRPTPPLSGRSTPSNLATNGTGQKPLSRVPSGSRSKSSTPANDSFANLVSFNASLSTKNLSLQEQQRLLQEQKTKQEDEKRRQFDNHFGVAHTISALPEASNSAPPTRFVSPPTYTATEEYGGQKLSRLINKPFAGIPDGDTQATSRTVMEDHADLLTALDSSVPIRKSHHMPALVDSGTSDNASDHSGEVSRSVTPQRGDTSKAIIADTEDDDPFGLGPVTASASAKSEAIGQTQDEDDVLGLLSRPVSDFPQPGPTRAVESNAPSAIPSDPFDRAIAELVDMGFSLDMSKTALESTQSRTDVQAAVGWLLNQAHENSRKEKQRQGSRRRDLSSEPYIRRAPSRRKSSGSGGSRPSWMKEQGRTGSTKNRQESKSLAKSEKDPAQLASELGNNFIKTANSLWKTGAKKLNQAVADFNVDVDPSHPKWMREVQGEATSRKKQSQQRNQEVTDHNSIDAGESSRKTPTAPRGRVTDEALLLEVGDARPQRKHQTTSLKADSLPTYQDDLTKPRQPMPANYKDPAPQQPKLKQQAQPRDPSGRLNRQAVEEEAAQAYISPARRRKPTPKPTLAESEPEFFSDASKTASRPLAPESRAARAAPVPPRTCSNTAFPTRPPPPRRRISPISPSAIQQSTLARQAGTAAFKRGDYAQATIHYTTSLSALPASHPLTMPILTNRALSHLKTGDPKACIADAKTTLELIGPSRGVGETIDLGGGEGVKSMDTYWGKAMTRQAEALEQLERWIDAAASWRACVEAGVGGATSMAGRNRCENATKPKPIGPVENLPARSLARPALSDLPPITGQSAEAVSRLRAAKIADDKLDDEKFALADQVDARVMKWRAGKEGNLRALLSSLESVLWEDAAWKKVGMGDLLLPAKVKIMYMKGIAKVHPDKLPTTATTEQKMISATVFATLNEAWERFKQENGL